MARFLPIPILKGLFPNLIALSFTRISILSLSLANNLIVRPAGKMPAIPFEIGVQILELAGLIVKLLFTTPPENIGLPMLATPTALLLVMSVMPLAMFPHLMRPLLEEVPFEMLIPGTLMLELSRLRMLDPKMLVPGLQIVRTLPLPTMSFKVLVRPYVPLLLIPVVLPIAI